MKNKTTPVALGARTAKSGKIYVYDLERQTRTDYREFMNPATEYERVYYQVNVYVDGKLINFGFVDDANDSAAIYDAVTRVIEWDETPSEVLASMHSRYD